MASMNQSSPYPSATFLVQSRYYGGKFAELPAYMEELMGDSEYLASIPNSKEVKTSMDGILSRRAMFHVPDKIRLHGWDDPRCYMLATYSGFSNPSGGLPPLTDSGEALWEGMLGVIATLERRLVFCWRGHVFPVVEGMYFWGWTGLPFRVAWRQHRGVLRDIWEQWALPHDADEASTKSWTTMENLWKNLHLEAQGVQATSVDGAAPTGSGNTPPVVPGQFGGVNLVKSIPPVLSLGSGPLYPTITYPDDRDQSAYSVPGQPAQVMHGPLEDEKLVAIIRNAASQATQVDSP